MSQSTIVCEKCGNQIELTSALQGALRAELQKEFEAKQQARQAELEKQQQAIASREQALADDRGRFDRQLQEAIEAARAKLSDEERKRASAEVGAELTAIRQELEAKQQKLIEAQKRELDLARRERDLSEQRLSLELEAEQKLQAQMQSVRAEEAKKALVLSGELDLARKALDAKESELRAAAEAAKAEAARNMDALLQERTRDMAMQLQQATKDLEETRSTELALRQKQIAFESRERQLDLEIQRRLDEQKAQIRLEEDKRRAETEAQMEQLKQAVADDARKRAEEKASLELEAKELQIKRLSEKISQLQHATESRSAELQGEALEEKLKETLTSDCDLDQIEDVAKGKHGADLIQTVRSGNLQVCGKILWEAKNAANWSEKWVEKLQSDQLEADADIAVIVTTALPKGVNSFALYKGSVWVTGLSFVPGLACALRHALLRVATERSMAQGRDAKMEALYGFLTSNEFRLNVQQIMKSVAAMNQEIDKEEQAMQRIWKRRRKQVQMLSTSAIGVLGGFEGILNRQLVDDPTLALDAPEDELELEEV